MNLSLKWIRLQAGSVLFVKRFWEIMSRLRSIWVGILLIYYAEPFWVKKKLLGRR